MTGKISDKFVKYSLDMENIDRKILRFIEDCDEDEGTISTAFVCALAYNASQYKNCDEIKDRYKRYLDMVLEILKSLKE